MIIFIAGKSVKDLKILVPSDDVTPHLRFKYHRPRV